MQTQEAGMPDVTHLYYREDSFHALKSRDIKW